jgi:ABC-type transport system substrate-binding protein
MHARRHLLVLSLAAVVAMTGCASKHNEPTIKPTESRDRMKAFVGKSESVLGSAGWRDVSGAIIQGCPLRDGGEGVNYGYTRLGSGSDDVERDAAIIEDFWQSHGYKTKVVRSSNPKNKTIQVFGVGDAVRSIGFSVDSGYTAFSVESECIPGDVGQIIDSGDF